MLLGIFQRHAVRTSRVPDPTLSEQLHLLFLLPLRDHVLLLVTNEEQPGKLGLSLLDCVGRPDFLGANFSDGDVMGWLGLEFGEQGFGGPEVGAGAPVDFDRVALLDSMNSFAADLGFFLGFVLMLFLVGDVHHGHDVALEETHLRLVLVFELGPREL